MTEPAREEQLGVWCRKCGATTFETKRTDRCLEGDVRLHVCKSCGAEFGSIATFLKAAAARQGKFTPLARK